MWTHNINPTIIDLGALEIRWYGVMYLLAFFITLYYGRHRIKQGKLQMTTKQLDDLLGYNIIAMIIGARTFYFLFYNLDALIAKPLSYFAVWQGGLSFHGGLLGIIIATWWYVKKHKLKFWTLADTLAIPIALGNALGRLGNFINAELYGKVTTLPWGVVFPGAEGTRHPTQIYEAAYNVVIFLILYKLRDKLKTGQIFALFLMLYAVFRFSVEFIKELPTTHGLTIGQWLTIPLLVIGCWLWVISSRSKRF